MMSPLSSYRLFLFPKPRRDTNTLELLVEKRLSRNWNMIFSYTYMKVFGNYPGLYTSNNGQADPNLSSQYDLPSLLINRMGNLDTDIRHSVKLDGYYDYDMGLRGDVIAGPSIRVHTGTPRNVLGREDYYRFGPDQVLMDPRGTAI